MAEEAYQPLITWLFSLSFSESFIGNSLKTQRRHNLRGEKVNGQGCRCKDIIDLAVTHCGESSSAKTFYKHLILCCAHCWRWFRGVTSHRGRKNAISVFHHSSTQGTPIKILLCIKFDTPTPSVADVKAQWAYCNGVDSTRGHWFCTFYFLGILYLEIPPSDFTW